MIVSIYIAIVCVDACHSNASCQIINGTNICVCKSGFTGNGTICDIIGHTY